jgi:hypothetical protein
MENSRRQNDLTEKTTHSHDLKQNKRSNGIPVSFDGMNYEQQRGSYKGNDPNRSGRNENNTNDRINEREY